MKKSYENFLKNSDLAILIIDENYKIVFYSDAFLKILRANTNFHIDEIIPVDGAKLIYISVNETKDFNQIIFHQFKAPLAVTKWITESLLELNEEQRLKLKDLYNENQYSIDLVNDLLNIAKIESGKFKVSRGRIDIKLAIGKMIKIFQPMANKKKQEIIFKEEYGANEAYIDRNLFIGALSNLLEDAIDYGDENSAVTITLLTDKERANLIIAVNSRGPVISDEDKDKIFTKFYRGEKAEKIKPLGSGLGLYIAKLYTEMNNGKIWFDSSSEKGTTFYFSVPIKSK